MAELQNFSEKDLQTKFDEKNGSWLYNIARGIDLEPVQARFNPKSIGCCKQLRGKAALVDLDSLKKWLKDLGDEIEDRLEKDALENNRTPKQMVVSFSVQLTDGRDCSSSRSYNFSAEDELCGVLFSNKALELLMDSAEGCKPKDDESNRRLKAPIKFLGISVGKFEDNVESKKTKKIKDYFAAGSSKETITKLNENSDNKSNLGKDYVLRKFLNSSKDTNENNCVEKEPEINSNCNEKILESTLDKQESFFAKFLNGSLKLNVNKTQHELKNNAVEYSSKVNRSNTPECDVITCGDDSNDTAYSGSTINEEINKSIALFEDDPDDSTRVSNMRQLLNNSKEPTQECDDVNIKTEKQVQRVPITPDFNSNPLPVETIKCSECNKSISLDKLDEHADYHLAINLRAEERQQVRKERDKIVVKEVNIKELKKKRPVSEVCNKNEMVSSSIANFLTKIEVGVPTEICIECGKRVLIEKISEHQDFHEAQKLSRELNNKQTLTNLASNTVKRKRKSASPIKKPKVQCKSIDLFFRS